jgi:hypothetical protein
VGQIAVSGWPPLLAIGITRVKLLTDKPTQVRANFPASLVSIDSIISIVYGIVDHNPQRRNEVCSLGPLAQLGSSKNFFSAKFKGTEATIMTKVWPSGLAPWGSVIVTRRVAVTVAIFAATISVNPRPTQAATFQVASPYGAAEVSAALANALSGDTVVMPGFGGPFTWTGGVTLSSSKCLTLDLNGREVILSGASGQITVQAHPSCLNRVTNGTVTKSGTAYQDYVAPFKIQDSPTGYAVRVDHITFQGVGLTLADGVYIDINGQGPGLFDHNTFPAINPVYEFIHIRGWGAVNTTGWTTPVDKGGAGLFYFEDNSFSNATTGGGGNNAWIQGYNGARVVIRFNNFNFVAVDAHGTPGNIGQRWWETYNNNFNHINSNDSNTYQVNLRGGSGLIFNNVGSSGAHPTRTGMCEEDTGYPASYQIGRGTNQILDPAYYFGNITLSLDINGCDAPAQGGMVALNRDVYSSTSASCTPGGDCATGVGAGATLPTTCTTGVGFWKTDAGGNWNTAGGGANDGALYKCTSTNTWTLYYTPYQYPHPLSSGSGQISSTPQAPSNLRIASQ